MATAEYNVTGMSCGHCEKAVVDEVSKIAGVISADASAARGTLKITSEVEVKDSDVLAAVEEAGYTAQAA
jgi:copper chaperone CopZ